VQVKIHRDDDLPGKARSSHVYAARYQHLTSREQNKLTHTRPKL